MSWVWNAKPSAGFLTRARGQVVISLTDTWSLQEKQVLGEKLDSALGHKLEMHVRHSSRYSEKPKFDNATLEF